MGCMMTQKLLEQIHENLDSVINQSNGLGIELWKELVKLHPADIAELLGMLDFDNARLLFLKFPQSQQLDIFLDLSQLMKVNLLESLDEHDRNYIITHLSIDDLTDFLDDLSDEELQKYLKLLHKRDQKRVLSLLEFSPESAGGIMYTDVLSLMQDFTVEKSIQIIRRLQPSRELHQQVYVVNQNQELVGHINLEDLVLKDAKTYLHSILQPNVLIVQVHEDREVVAKDMLHYGISIAPVVDEENIFLGVIPSEALAEVIEEEAGEDIYRMSALSPIKYTYFETPFSKLLYQRSIILIILLLVQTFSSMILKYYEVIMSGFLTYFITMLTSTGGNASSQTSALAIQGLATGEIDEDNSKRFIMREFLMALIIALILGVFSFLRTYLSYGNLLGSITVSFSLSIIVLTSIVLGSCMPLLLKRCNIDPAHSAGPLLTTIIDVIGLLLYCFISGLVFKYFA